MLLTLGNRWTFGQEALVPNRWALRPIASLSVLGWIVVAGLAMSALALVGSAALVLFCYRTSLPDLLSKAHLG